MDVVGEVAQLMQGTGAETVDLALSTAAPASALIRCDGRMLILDVEVNARRLLTRRRDQLVGQPFLRFLHEDDVASVDELVRHLLTGGLGSATVDLDVVPLYGKPVPVALTVTNLSGAPEGYERDGSDTAIDDEGQSDGRPEGALLLALSPLRRTSRDPEPAAVGATTIDDRSPDLITRLRLWPEPAFDYVSPSAETLLGYPPRAFYSDPRLLHDLIDDPAELDQLFELERGWEPHEPLVLHLRHREGHIVVLEQQTTRVHDGEGQLLAVEGIARDVTAREDERTRYTTAVAATRRLHELAGVDLETVEPAVVIEATVDAICSHLGWPVGHGFLLDEEPGFLISAPWFEADPSRSERLRVATDDGRWSVHSDLVSEAVILVEQVVTDLPDASESERSVLAAACGYRYAVTIPVPVGEGLGAVLEFFVDGPRRPSAAVVAGIADVADEMGRALARSHAVLHLRRVDQARQEFVAKAAHELRGPIGSIALMASALARQARDSNQGPMAASLDSLVVQAERIQGMATRLLELSQLDDGRVRLDPELLAVEVVVAAAIAARPPSTVRPTPRVPAGLKVYADPSLLDAILSNLLANAERYAATCIEIVAEAVEGGVAITVGDDGPGVATELVADLFQPLRSTLATPDRGGLGLALVHRMAASMSGDVRYESGHPHGARFVVSLPDRASD